MDWSALPVWGGLLLLGVLVSALANDRRMLRTSALLLGNWFVCNVIVALTDRYDPWPLFWLLDLATAIVICLPPSTRWQKFITGVYIAMVGVHAAYGLSDNSDGATLYLALLDVGLALQIIVIGSWAGWNAYCHHHPGRVRRIDGSASALHRSDK